MTDHSKFDPLKCIRTWQNPAAWWVMIESAAEWKRRRAEDFERAIRGEPPRPLFSGQCRELSVEELQEIVVGNEDGLKAVVEYVRERNVSLLPLIPVVNFMLPGAPKLDPETAAANMRGLEAELSAGTGPDEYSRPRSPADWVKLLRTLGDEMSNETFRLRRRDGTYQTKTITSKSIQIRLKDLPATYRDDLKV